MRPEPTVDSSVAVTKIDEPWVGKGPQARPSPAVAAPVVAPAAAIAVAKPGPVVKPTDVLRLVKNGDLELEVPVRPVELFKGRVVAEKNTVVRMSLRVKDGNIDFANSKLKFDPELKGPMGVPMPGVSMTSDGRIAVELEWMPDLMIGNRSSSRLSDFVDAVTSGKELPVKALGVQLGGIGGEDEKDARPPVNQPDLAVAHPEARQPEKSNLTRLTDKIDFNQTRIRMHNVQFMDGAVPLGEGGRVRLTPDSRVGLEGTLANLSLTGKVGVAELQLDAHGTKIEGGRGTGELSVSWKTDANLNGTVEAALTNLTLQAETAISRRPNGDFIDLAKGRMQNASLTLSQAVSAGRPVGTPKPVLSIERFEGVINGGQISVPDGNGVAQIVLGKSAVKGRVEASADRVFVSGDVDLNARVTGLDVTGDLGLTVSKLDVTGKARITYDSAQGLTVDGPVRAQATIDGSSGALGKSTLNVSTNQVRVGLGGELSVRGRAAVDVELKDVQMGRKGVALKGGNGSLKGEADISLDRNGVSLSRGALQVSASIEDGTFALGDAVTMDLKRGTSLEAAVTAATFGKAGTTLDLRKARVTAALDAGRVTLPNGQAIDFKDGTQLELKLDRLRFPDGGIPEAQGTIELQARLGAGEVDRRLLVNVPGVSFSQIEGIEQVFKLRMGRFSITSAGAFDVQDLSFGVEAQVRRLGGQIR